MTRSTLRTGLPRAAALLVAVALATSWARSEPALAFSTVGNGGGTATAQYLADQRFDTAPVVSSAWLRALH